MDHGAFNRMARHLGARLSRRDGIAGGIAAAAAAAMPLARALAAPVERPPCGPDGPDGKCAGAGDERAKRCRKSNGGTRRRCRCIKQGKACRKGRTCCGGTVCRNRTCQPRCMVCASGCSFTTLEAAYAAAAPGGVVSIDSGTYPTEIIVTKDITFAACNGAPDVVLVPARSTTTPDSYYAVIAEDPAGARHHAVTLDGLTIAGNPGRDDEALLTSWYNGKVSWTIRGCTISGASEGLWTFGGAHVLERSAFTDCAYPTYFVMSGPAASVTVTDCAFTNNGTAGVISEGGVTTVTGCTFTGNGDGGIGVYDGALTAIDTRVTGNSATKWGGGIWGYSGFGGNLNASIALGGSTVVTGNTAPDGSGVAIREADATTVTVTGVSSANVYGNLTGDQCERSVDGAIWTPVANCAF